MKAMTDIRRTAAGDLDLSGGDIHWGECTLQHQQDILLARQGDYRTSLLTGVDIENYLEDENNDDLYQAIRTQFAADGMRVTKVGAQIEAEYV